MVYTINVFLNTILVWFLNLNSCSIRLFVTCLTNESTWNVPRLQTNHRVHAGSNWFQNYHSFSNSILGHQSKRVFNLIWLCKYVNTLTVKHKCHFNNRVHCVHVRTIHVQNVFLNNHKLNSWLTVHIKPWNKTIKTVVLNVLPLAFILDNALVQKPS